MNYFWFLIKHENVEWWWLAVCLAPPNNHCTQSAVFTGGYRAQHHLSPPAAPPWQHHTSGGADEFMTHRVTVAPPVAAGRGSDVPRWRKSVASSHLKHS